MAVFTRTPGGLAQKWRFYNVPTIWVEGPTDKYFYGPILDDISHRIEAFHGHQNSKKLILSLKKYNHPYLVVLDGDYSILRRSRSPHRRVIILPRYSVENFLWEPNAINQACLRHTQCSNQKDLVITSMNSVINNIKTELLDAIVLDVAARRMKTSPAVLPKRIESLLKNGANTDFNTLFIKKLVENTRGEIDAEYVEEVEREVSKFLKTRCISHLINGHLLFGLLRRVFLRAAKKEKRSNSVISNDFLIQLLVDAVWRHCRSGDHNNLRRNFRRKLQELVLEYSAKKT